MLGIQRPAAYQTVAISIDRLRCLIDIGGSQDARQLRYKLYRTLIFIAFLAYFLEKFTNSAPERIPNLGRGHRARD